MSYVEFIAKSYYNAFDIEIRDHKGHLFPRSAIANFVLQLVFESVEEIEHDKTDIHLYNEMGYRLGHPTSSGFSSR